MITFTKKLELINAFLASSVLVMINLLSCNPKDKQLKFSSHSCIFSLISGTENCLRIQYSSTCWINKEPNLDSLFKINESSSEKPA